MRHFFSTRVRVVLIIALLLAIGAISVMGTFFTFFYGPAISLYHPDPEVIATGKIKLLIAGWSYIPYVISEVLLGCLRGMKRSSVPTAINLICMCAIRVGWVQFIFPLHRTLEWLCMSYPASYICGAIGMGVYYLYTIRVLSKKQLPA